MAVSNVSTSAVHELVRFLCVVVTALAAIPNCRPIFLLL